jgi:putative endonuclease
VTYYVYILASRSKRLYTGMTNSLESRVFQHKQGRPGSHAHKYNINRLVYMEEYALVHDAIAREKQIKDWRREKRVALIESLNPEWDDIAEHWYPGPRDSSLRSE